MSLSVSGTASAQISTKGRPPIPHFTKWPVIDETNTLTDQQMQALSQKLAQYRDSTSTEIVILLVTTLNGYPATDYAIEAAQENKIGQAKKNNGALILLALNDRKGFIATGYGMEPILTDSVVSLMYNNILVPDLRAKRVFRGLDRITSAMMAKLDEALPNSHFPTSTLTHSDIQTDDSVTKGQALPLEEAVKAQIAQLNGVFRARAEFVPNIVTHWKRKKNVSAQLFDMLTRSQKAVERLQLNLKIVRDSDALANFLSKEGNLGENLGFFREVLMARYSQYQRRNAFVSLLAKLEGYENRIRVELRRYNELAFEYNHHSRNNSDSGSMGTSQFRAYPYFYNRQSSMMTNELPSIESSSAPDLGPHVRIPLDPTH